jgi:hypothetical protein
VAALGPRFWSDPLDQEPSLVREIPQADSAAFLLSVGLQQGGLAATNLVTLTFEIVHRAAFFEKLSYRGWQMLEPEVPSLGWGYNWDKCKRLRRVFC